MKTRAEPDDDGYVVNGSKIWTSYAARADVMFLLARVGGKGKGGVSCFIVPMDTPGLEVRPIPGVHSRHRSEEHTSELQSLIRISYAVFCWKKKQTCEPQSTIHTTYSCS